MKTESTPSIFICHADADEALRMKLETHLFQLKSDGLFTFWHDHQISAGENWEEAINSYLNQATVILLLLSPDFLISEYCYNEMGHALKRHERGEALVIPILLRPLIWTNAPFAHLGVLPSNGQAIVMWPDRDAAFENVAHDIQSTIEDFLIRKGEALFGSRRYEEALAAFQQVIRLDPASSDAYRGQGKAYEQLGKQTYEAYKQQAQECHDKARQLGVEQPAKQPEQRYQTANEFLIAFKNAFASQHSNSQGNQKEEHENLAGEAELILSGTLLNGRYRVERALGSGGFGHVYLSVDLHTKTQYAIKEYLVSGASGKARLEHEAQVLSQLHHPNLPAFFTAFDERGHHYVVFGYVEGNDLTDYVRVVHQKNEVIPLPRLMGWMLSICDAAAFLHSQRPPIIHRDIKPDNIRITPNGTAILVDLGNAKTAADGARTLFFIRHQGTPGYAPLEQYPGGTGTDERSDVYALGGTLYFALTAHEPPSVSARNQSLQQKLSDLPSLQERLAQNPPDVPQEQRQFRLGVSKPSKPAPRHSRHIAQLGTLPPDLLQKLDALIQRAMAMKPKDRYPSVLEFSNDLRTVLNALSDPSEQPVVDSRPVDPHSTQPDLPMLYDAHQNAQAASQGVASPQAQGQATQLPQAQGHQPPQPIPAQNVERVALRCPRCGKDLPRPASYCPRCGNSMNTSPGSGSSEFVVDLDAAKSTPGQNPQQNPNLPRSSWSQ